MKHYKVEEYSWNTQPFFQFVLKWNWKSHWKVKTIFCACFGRNFCAFGKATHRQGTCRRAQRRAGAVINFKICTQVKEAITQPRSQLSRLHNILSNTLYSWKCNIKNVPSFPKIFCLSRTPISHSFLKRKFDVLKCLDFGLWICFWNFC